MCVKFDGVSLAKMLLSENKINSILEIGCGDGRVIGQFGYVAIREGIDFSQERLNRAKENFPDVIFKLVDIRNVIDFYDIDSFDCVLLFDVLEHLEAAESDKLLMCAEAIARKAVVVWGPLGQDGLYFNVPKDDDPIGMKHVSIIDKKVFENRKYQVMVLPEYWLVGERRSRTADAMLAIRWQSPLAVYKQGEL